MTTFNNLVMVYDTETTGKTDFKAAYNAPHQPNIVQIGYKVFTPNKDVLFEIGHLVNTTGFKEWSGIEPDAQDVHHISEDLVRDYGISPADTLMMWALWAKQCSLFVGHNEQFDHNVMQCFAFRAGYNPGEIFRDGAVYCTMKSSTNICCIPSPKGGGYKWPKLNEAYPFFFNKQFDNAHNALADVNPTAEIFWAHIERGHYVLG